MYVDDGGKNLRVGGTLALLLTTIGASGYQSHRCGKDVSGNLRTLLLLKN